MKKILLTSRNVIAEDDVYYTRLSRMYSYAVEKAGALPLVAPITDDVNLIKGYVEMADAFIFTGGEDISPVLYDADFHPSVQYIDFKRDKFEEELYRLAKKSKKPILGICRGMQLINALEGGDLIQDIKSEVEGASGHSFEHDLTHGILKINIDMDSYLAKQLGKSEILVNQFHHQAVKNPAMDFKIVARSRDGIAEAMEYIGAQFIQCVQFHPESLVDNYPEFLNIFKDLIDRA